MTSVQVLDSRNLSKDEARAIAELIFKVWPKPEKPVEFREQQMRDLGRDYIGPDAQAPQSVLIRDGSRVIAHAALFPRTIGISQDTLTIAGLARVCTDPDFRGRGLGEIVVRKAFALMDQNIFPFSLFQANTTVQPFYEKLGACLVTNRIVNSLSQSPEECPFWDDVVLRYPKNRPWPQGKIDLRGSGY